MDQDVTVVILRTFIHIAKFISDSNTKPLKMGLFYFCIHVVLVRTYRKVPSKALAKGLPVESWKVTPVLQPRWAQITQTDNTSATGNSGNLSFLGYRTHAGI